MICLTKLSSGFLTDIELADDDFLLSKIVTKQNTKFLTI